VLLALCFLVWAVLVVRAPIDAMQGVIQKVLYVHVPCVLGAYLGFALTAFGGGLYLWRRDERWDRFAAASAEVGVLFCTLVLLSGPFWARGTWGKWWSWDLRLALTLLLFLVYVSYLLLRSFSEGSERGARFSAVYGIAGLALIPLNYFAIDLAGGRSIHPENLERGSWVVGRPRRARERPHGIHDRCLCGGAVGGGGLRPAPGSRAPEAAASARPGGE
jgi:heme exporter protein C